MYGFLSSKWDRQFFFLFFFPISFFFLVFVLRVEKSNGLGSPAAMHRPAVDLEKRVVLGWLVASGRRRMELAGTIVIFAAHDFGLNEREKGVKR